MDVIGNEGMGEALNHASMLFARLSPPYPPLPPSPLPPMDTYCHYSRRHDEGLERIHDAVGGEVIDGHWGRTDPRPAAGRSPERLIPEERHDERRLACGKKVVGRGSRED